MVVFGCGSCKYLNTVRCVKIGLCCIVVFIKEFSCQDMERLMHYCTSDDSIKQASKVKKLKLLEGKIYVDWNVCQLEKRCLKLVFWTIADEQ